MRKKLEITIAERNERLTEVVYFDVVPDDDLSLAAKRLSVPLWGRLLVGALCFLFAAIAGALWYGLTRMNSTDTTLKGIKDSIQVLADKTPDKDLINRLLSQARKAGEAALDEKLQPVQKKLKDIDASTKAVANEQQRLKERVDGQEAMIRIGAPARILAIIQEELRLAETNTRPLPAAQLADYKSAMHVTCLDFLSQP
jgi:hypothetical protein